jgi:hypothetical protein
VAIDFNFWIINTAVNICGTVNLTTYLAVLFFIQIKGRITRAESSDSGCGITKLRKVSVVVEIVKIMHRWNASLEV